jgi:hypothetical protein
MATGSQYLLSSLIVVVVLLAARPTHACAPAPPPREWVTIAKEEALIVWDADASTEHFVRRALFDTSAASFGFIVPTPAIPMLGEVPASVFDALDKVTAPPVMVTYTREYGPGCFFYRGIGMTKSAAEPDAVRVLAARTVAGYDAVVLEADDPTALSLWLKDHGYDDRPALRDWLAPYVSNHWKLTAFKLASDHTALLSAAVRMSFKTPQPFFPYREPKDQPTGAKRSLRVYTFAARRMLGNLGKDGNWPGMVGYARPAGPDVLALVAQAVPDYVTAAREGWLTRFDDESSPRPGIDEVYFSATSLGELPAPPVVISRPRTVRIPIDLVALGLIALTAVALVRRRTAR